MASTGREVPTATASCATLRTSCVPPAGPPTPPWQGSGQYETTPAQAADQTDRSFSAFPLRVRVLQVPIAHQQPTRLHGAPIVGGEGAVPDRVLPQPGPADDHDRRRRARIVHDSTNENELAGVLSAGFVRRRVLNNPLAELADAVVHKAATTTDASVHGDVPLTLVALEKVIYKQAFVASRLDPVLVGVGGHHLRVGRHLPEVHHVLKGINLAAVLHGDVVGKEELVVALDDVGCYHDVPLRVHPCARPPHDNTPRNRLRLRIKRPQDGNLVVPVGDFQFPLG
mmetsp:Transcript_3909/g.10837  ORF Transcript_3909/g.10837 Transcript_3909/m.10837 type:complete len:284 (-) Transcript_3909:753-1604(-)